MKKLFFILVLLASFAPEIFAQKTVKAGSVISVQNNTEVRVKDINVGDLVAFEVSEDFASKGEVLIPKGSKAFAKVLQASKSGMAGKKGKLKIEFVYCQVGSVKVPLEGEIDFARKNHTAGAVAAAAVVAAPLIFMTGQHAVIPAGYQNVATVKTDTELE